MHCDLTAVISVVVMPTADALSPGQNCCCHQLRRCQPLTSDITKQPAARSTARMHRPTCTHLWPTPTPFTRSNSCMICSSCVLSAGLPSSTDDAQWYSPALPHGHEVKIFCNAACSAECGNQKQQREDDRRLNEAVQSGTLKIAQADRQGAIHRGCCRALVAWHGVRGM